MTRVLVVRLCGPLAHVARHPDKPRRRAGRGGQGNPRSGIRAAPAIPRRSAADGQLALRPFSQTQQGSPPNPNCSGHVSPSPPQAAHGGRLPEPGNAAEADEVVAQVRLACFFLCCLLLPARFGLANCSRRRCAARLPTSAHCFRPALPSPLLLSCRPRPSTRRQRTRRSSWTRGCCERWRAPRAPRSTPWPPCLGAWWGRRWALGAGLGAVFLRLVSLARRFACYQRSAAACAALAARQPPNHPLFSPAHPHNKPTQVVKAASGKFHPLHQWFYFDSLESLPEGPLPTEEVAPQVGRRGGRREQEKQNQQLLPDALGVGCLPAPPPPRRPPALPAARRHPTANLLPSFFPPHSFLLIPGLPLRRQHRGLWAHPAGPDGGPAGVPGARGACQLVVFCLRVWPGCALGEP